MSIPVTLTDQELAELLPIFNKLDARTQGYSEGIAAAKQVLVQQILANRKVANEPHQQSAEHAAVQQNAAPGDGKPSPDDAASPTDGSTGRLSRAVSAASPASDWRNAEPDWNS